MAHSQEDRLAAVVLHALVSANPGEEPVTLEWLVCACERDPELSAERDTVQDALVSLVRDGLAEWADPKQSDAPHTDGLFKPTRAAIRAHELSF